MAHIAARLLTNGSTRHVPLDELVRALHVFGRRRRSKLHETFSVPDEGILAEADLVAFLLSESFQPLDFTPAEVFDTFCRDSAHNNSVATTDLYVMLSLLRTPGDEDLSEYITQFTAANKGKDRVTFTDFVSICIELHARNFPEVPQFRSAFGVLDVNNDGRVPVSMLHPAFSCVRPTLGADDVDRVLPAGATVSLPEFIRACVLTPGGQIDIQLLEQYLSAFTFFDHHQDGMVSYYDVRMVLRACGIQVPESRIGEIVAAIGEDDIGGNRVDLLMYLKVVAECVRQHADREAAVNAMRKATLCGECEQANATIECETCGEAYCKTCCDTVHSKGRRKQHGRFLKIVVCGECGVMQATLKCARCKEMYCEVCSAEVHGKGNRRVHVRHGDVNAINPLELRLFRYNTVNGFGINVKRDLKSERFTQKASAAFEDSGGYPVKSDVEDVMEALEMELGICKEGRAEYIDTACALVDEELHSWRRPGMYQHNAALFTQGNKSLAALPHPALWSPVPEWCNYLIKYSRGSGRGFGDTWFLWATSIVSTNLLLFRNLFVSAEHYDLGAMVFQFNDSTPADHTPMHTVQQLSRKKGPLCPKDWRCVVVDTMLPVKEHGALLFGGVHDKREVWACLLEKAYAKYLGSFDSLAHGDASEALRNLSGGNTLVMQWDPLPTYDDVDYVWWLLSLCLRNGVLVGMCFDPSAQDKGDEIRVVDDTSKIMWTQCVQPLHALQLVQPATVTTAETKAFPAGHRIVKLKSTLGDVQHTGDWSDASRLWTAPLRKIMNNRETNEYVTWMSIEDLCKRVNTVVLCGNSMILPPAVFPRMLFGQLDPCPRGHEPRHAQQYLLSVQETANHLKAGDLQRARIGSVSGTHPALTQPISQMEVPPLRIDEDESDDDFEEDGAEVDPSGIPIPAPAPVRRATFTVHVHLYVHPERDQREAFLHNTVLELTAYRVTKRALQPLLVVPTKPSSRNSTSQSASSSRSNSVTAAAATVQSDEYCFAFHNKLELVPSQETEGPLHYYSTLPLTVCGNFALVVTSAMCEQRVRYALVYSEQDDEQLPLHVTTKLESLGSHNHSLV
eukprot:PhM_4_TR4230/c0_g1_i1/m.58107